MSKLENKRLASNNKQDTEKPPLKYARAICSQQTTDEIRTSVKNITNQY